MFTQYDPGLVTVIIGGRTMVGFHSGSFVKVSRKTDTWKHEKGSQGDGVRTRSRDKSGELVITLQATSPSNADLREIMEADENPLGIPDTVAVLVKYNGINGAELWAAKDGWINKPADGEFGDEHTPREWTITCDEILTPAI